MYLYSSPLTALRRAIVTNHLNECGHKAITQIRWLQEVEKRPHTMNDHYFSDYKEKFLALYRGNRQSSNHSQLVTKLKQHGSTRASTPYARPLSKSPSPSFDDSTTKVLSGLGEMGIPAKPIELLKLLPSDPLEPALHIMSTVRAYFQGQPILGAPHRVQRG